MPSPSTYPYESSTLRAFIRSTSLSSVHCHLAYVPPSDAAGSQSLCVGKSASLGRPPSPHHQPIRRAASFANLIDVLRRPSLPLSSGATTAEAEPFVDLRHELRAANTQARLAPKSRPAPIDLAIPIRSSSLGWLQDATSEFINQHDDRSVFTLQLYKDDEDDLELEVAAELRETFEEWEERFGLRQDTQDVEPLDPLSPTSTASLSPTTSSHLRTPAPTLFDSLSPLRSRFSCDSDDDDRAAVLDLVQDREVKRAVSVGKVGRLTRKMSSAIALSIAQKSPLGRRMGLGRRDTA